MENNEGHLKHAELCASCYLSACDGSKLLQYVAEISKRII